MPYPGCIAVLRGPRASFCGYWLGSPMPDISSTRMTQVQLENQRFVAHHIFSLQLESPKTPS
ncbi:hypothetical protein C5167_047198 [Papaver somniferum]|uniref:Uncharacterized protein n=1 Tax=Papaver somniferum TaxID=3469 RepID=A0A4Y7LIG2_PAPSO|nr:hypothetical protein C5167_047198 [Papaver somniferum]